MVGAIDQDEAKIGRDLGDVAGLGRQLGITVQFSPRKVLDNIKADVVLQATTAFMDDAFPQIMEVLERKINVVTIAQELFFPLGQNVEKAKKLDIKAKEMGVSIAAVGINPGFIMDIIPIVCSLPCWEIEKVFVRRIVDFSHYGLRDQRSIGAGLSPQEFIKGVKEGVIGHIGLLETAAMVAYCLGLHIDKLRQKKEFILTQKGRRSNVVHIGPGKVCGFKQDVLGLRGREEILNFRMVGLISPDKEEDGVELGDYARIDGTPSVDITIKEEISQKGGLGAAGVAVNMIPRIIEAPPGFHTMNTLALPHIWSSGPQSEPIKNIYNLAY